MKKLILSTLFFCFLAGTTFAQSRDFNSKSGATGEIKIGSYIDSTFFINFLTDAGRTLEVFRDNAIIKNLKPGTATLNFALDKSSPSAKKLRTSSKKRIPNLALRIKHRDGYYEYQLKNVIVTSYSTSGSAADAEDFSLNFEEIKVTYRKRPGRKK